jgi:GTP cyclohydrolase I
VNTKKIEAGIRLVLEGIGVDLDDRNYKDTPKRVARMYREIFTPAKNNFNAFPETYNNMIILRNHHVTGMCPHHLLPVRFRISLGYIPNGQVLGLSKLGRAIEDHLTEPVLQEALTDSIVQTLHLRINPKGAGCVVVGEHDCMQCRGLRTDGDVVTSSMTGQFLLNASTREEFLRLIGRI